MECDGNVQGINKNKTGNRDREIEAERVRKEADGEIRHTCDIVLGGTGTHL